MKSGTSFFNGTAFRKNITRFFPVWSIYLIGCIVVLVSILSEFQPSMALRDLGYTLCLMAVVNMIYAMTCGVMLFGDLFHSRLCNAIHAMPLRREGWFLTNVASGLCFGFVPYLVLALCFIPRLEWHWAAAFVWMLAADLQFLFFFALAVFCVFCTGSRFAAALVYGLINFLSLLVGWLIDTIYIPLLNGVVFNWDPCHKLCPVVQLVMNEDYFFWYDKIERSKGLGGSWVYLIILAVVAVALLIGSLLLYRKRKLEYAGDFLAVKRLEPVFHIIYTLTMGTMFHLFHNLFLYESSWIVFLIVGLVIGYFTGQMLLQRTVRVFQWKTFLGFGILTVVLLVSLGLTKLDPLGIGTWVPKAEQVAGMEISCEPYDYYYDRPMEFTEEEIPQGQELHRQMIEQNGTGGRRTEILVRYTLKSGREVYRQYEILIDSPLGQELNRRFSSMEQVLGYDDWETCLDQLIEARVENSVYTGEKAKELLKAVKADCDAGTMAQEYDFHNGDTYVWIMFIFKDQDRGMAEVVVTKDAENTVNFLKPREREWLYAYGK